MNIPKLRRIFVHFQGVKRGASDLCNPFYNAGNGQKDQQVGYILRRKSPKHNGLIPRNHWLLEAEKQAIVAFHHRNPLDGYRRLSYLMLDALNALISTN
jgi:hypothetical protein